MATAEQRLGQLEGAYEHLATKADLSELKADLKGEMAVHLRWMMGLQLAGLTAVAAILKILS